MKITLKRLDNAFHMEAVNELGHTAHSDGSLKIGGGNQAMSPMQLLLTAAGTCSSIDVISILGKQKQPLEDIHITLEGEREQGAVPSLFTKVHMHYLLTGALDVKKVERAIELSVNTYCSASKTLEKAGAEITWSYEIQPSKIS